MIAFEVKRANSVSAKRPGFCYTEAGAHHSQSITGRNSVSDVEVRSKTWDVDQTQASVCCCVSPKSFIDAAPSGHLLADCRGKKSRVQLNRQTRLTSLLVVGRARPPSPQPVRLSLKTKTPSLTWSQSRCSSARQRGRGPPCFHHPKPWRWRR